MNILRLESLEVLKSAFYTRHFSECMVPLIWFNDRLLVSESSLAYSSRCMVKLWGYRSPCALWNAHSHWLKDKFSACTLERFYSENIIIYETEMSKHAKPLYPCTRICTSQRYSSTTYDVAIEGGAEEYNIILCSFMYSPLVANRPISASEYLMVM